MTLMPEKSLATWQTPALEERRRALLDKKETAKGISDQEERLLQRIMSILEERQQFVQKRAKNILTVVDETTERPRLFDAGLRETLARSGFTILQHVVPAHPSRLLIILPNVHGNANVIQNDSQTDEGLARFDRHQETLSRFVITEMS